MICLFVNAFSNRLKSYLFRPVSAWWDWSAERITKYLEVLTSNDELALRKAMEDNM